jgi:hypothetical protein
MQIKIDGNLRIKNLEDPGIEGLNKCISDIYNIKKSCILRCFLKKSDFPIIKNLNDGSTPANLSVFNSSISISVS